jgi:3-methyl-2-oxobutanoate hydroxymethyltransferase
VSEEQALANCARMIQEGGVGAVKMEGGERFAPTIERIVNAGIPVMAHIGLLPQSVHKLGGLRRMQGKDVVSARQLLQDAVAVENAGAFAMVVEGVPAELGRLITQRVTIPTIGIAAGPDCDGQVQVFHDLLGLFDAFMPKHAKRYVEGAAVFKKALTQFTDDVRARRFPTADNAVHMTQEVLSALFSEDDED